MNASKKTRIWTAASQRGINPALSICQVRPSFTSGRLGFRIGASLFNSTRSLILRIYLPCEPSLLPMLTMSTPAPNFVAVCRNANLPLNDLHRLAPSSSRTDSPPLPPALPRATPAPPTTPGGGIITPRPAAPPPAPATTPTAAPAPPRMARHRPLRAPPVLLSVAHPRSPTSSTVAEPGPTPGRPPYPFPPTFGLLHLAGRGSRVG